MSLLSSRRLQVTVGSTTVKGVLSEGWRSQTILAEHACQRTMGSDVMDASAAITRVLTEVAGKVPTAGADLYVEVADELLTYDVAEGEFAGMSEREIGAVAYACVGDLLGDVVTTWLVKWQLQRDERHLLLCAMPRSLLNALQAVETTQQLKLVSLTSSFINRWNQNFAPPWPPQAVVAAVSSTNAMMAAVASGTVIALANGPWHSPSSAIGALESGMLDVQADRLIASVGWDADSGVARLFAWVDDEPIPPFSLWQVLSPTRAS